jgi:glutathione S-transferase
MKLYYTPSVCSLAPHIVLREAGYEFELEKVNLKTKKTESGEDFSAINDKSSVPFLVLDSGETLTEGVAIVQYLADQKPETNLAPSNGTMERVHLQEWLSYISTEIHKTHWPLFYTNQVGEQASQVYLEKLKKAYDYVSNALKDKQYLMGDRFTVADAYMYTVLNWHKFIKIDMSPWPVLVEYQQRVAARPKVQEALRAEGLLKA